MAPATWARCAPPPLGGRPPDRAGLLRHPGLRHHDSVTPPHAGTIRLDLGEGRPADDGGSGRERGIEGHSYRVQLVPPVGEVVRVLVDGEVSATLWAPPYTCDLTDQLHGRSTVTLRLEVSNTTANALAADDTVDGLGGRRGALARSTVPDAGPRAGARGPRVGTADGARDRPRLRAPPPRRWCVLRWLGGFLQGRAPRLPGRLRARSGRARSPAAVRRASTPGCGPPPPRPTSPIPATGSIRRCGSPGSSIAISAAATGMTDDDRAYLVARGIGITNLVNRATARADELTADELRAGRTQLEAFVAAHRPAVVAVARHHGVPDRVRHGRGRSSASSRSGSARPACGSVPNPSGLNAHDTIASLASAYAEPARAAGLELTRSSVPLAAAAVPTRPADTATITAVISAIASLTALAAQSPSAQLLGSRPQRLLVLAREHLRRDAGRLQQRDQGDGPLGRRRPVDQGRPQPVPDLLPGAGSRVGWPRIPNTALAARSARRAAPARRAGGPSVPCVIGFPVIGLIRFLTF